MNDEGDYDGKISSSYRAKLKIVEAFDRLCTTKPYDRISVKAIVHEANISRSGFYYHFQDKNAVLLWLTDQSYKVGLYQTGRTLTWFEGHMRTTRCFLDFKALLVSGSQNREYSGGQPYYVRNRQRNLIETVTKYQHKELTEQLRFQIEALPYSEMAMANKFVAGELGIELKEFCAMMEAIVPQELHDALMPPAEAHKNMLESYLLR